MDGRPADAPRILFSYSADKARSWSKPRVLSEQRESEYGAYLPTIAVNKYGFIAATWYDRRGLPTGDKGAIPPPGSNERLRVSCDGGESWTPSVLLNETPLKGSCHDFADTAGLAADADGRFHAAWIDDRTGTRQVWTATVRVQQKGAAKTASLPLTGGIN